MDVTFSGRTCPAIATRLKAQAYYPVISFPDTQLSTLWESDGSCPNVWPMCEEYSIQPGDMMVTWPGVSLWLESRLHILNEAMSVGLK